MKFFAPVKLSENMRLTPEGFLVCLGVAIARTGEMVYGPNETPIEPGPDGRVIISRDEKEVFNEATMASFGGKPVTLLHPTDDVTPANWSVLSKGSLQNVRRGSGEQANDLVADVLIMDARAIAMVQDEELREVSCGYEAEYFQVEPGRGYQTNIIGNHLALVENGRAGMSYAIRDQKEKGIDDMKTRDEKTKKDNWKTRISAIFTKAQTDATKVLDEAGAEEVDAVVGDEDPEDKGDKKPSYDELVKICDALKGEVAELKKGKDEAGGKKDDEEVKDEDPMAALIARMDAFEAKLAKLMEGKDSDEVEDEESEEVVETEDEAEVQMTGDTAARAEILAPGIKHTKNLKVEALKKAFGTQDGEAAIKRFTGGKAPAYDNASTVDMLFVGASELLKASRSGDMASTKRQRCCLGRHDR